MNIYLMIGSPGAGKSQYCTVFLGNVQVISCDLIRESMFGPLRSYEIRQIVLEKIKATIKEKVQLGEDIVLDTTYFNEMSSRAFLFDFDNAIKVHAIYVNTPLEECLIRNKQRAPERVIPDKMLEMLYERISPPSREERFESITVINSTRP